VLQKKLSLYNCITCLALLSPHLRIVLFIFPPLITYPWIRLLGCCFQNDKIFRMMQVCQLLSGVSFEALVAIITFLTFFFVVCKTKVAWQFYPNYYFQGANYHHKNCGFLKPPYRFQGLILAAHEHWWNIYHR